MRTQDMRTSSSFQAGFKIIGFLRVCSVCSRSHKSYREFVNNSSTLPNNTTMDRDGNVYMAKLAEQVNNFDSMFLHMSFRLR